MKYKQGEINEIIGLALGALSVTKNIALAAKEKLAGNKKKKIQPSDKTLNKGTETVEDNMKYTQGNIEEGIIANTMATIHGKRATSKVVGKAQPGAITRLHAAEAKLKSGDAYADAILKNKLKRKANKISVRDAKEKKAGKKPGLLKRVLRKITGRSTKAGKRAGELARIADSPEHKSGRAEGYAGQSKPQQRGVGTLADSMDYGSATYISEGGTQSAARKVVGAKKAYKKGKISVQDVWKTMTRDSRKRVTSQERLANRDAKRDAESEVD